MPIGNFQNIHSNIYMEEEEEEQGKKTLNTYGL